MIAAPLHALTSVKSVFQWSPEVDAAFRRLRTAFTSAPVLTVPDPQRSGGRCV